MYVLTDSSLDSRIETIVIPADSVMSKRMPPPFPTKDFCVDEDEVTNANKDSIETRIEQDIEQAILNGT